MISKRERLITAASDLIHRQGYHQTTLADVSSESSVPLGNIYYYFKSKDELGNAVIDNHSVKFQVKIDEWNKISGPENRLAAFLDLIDASSEMLSLYGCPYGSLCHELKKENSGLSKRSDDVLNMQIIWVTEQFHLMGKPDAVELGTQFIAMTQGASLLSFSKKDPTVIHQQVVRIKDWLATL